MVQEEKVEKHRGALPGSSKLGCIEHFARNRKEQTEKALISSQQRFFPIITELLPFGFILLLGLLKPFCLRTCDNRGFRLKLCILNILHIACLLDFYSPVLSTALFFPLTSVSQPYPPYCLRSILTMIHFGDRQCTKCQSYL